MVSALRARHLLLAAIALALSLAGGSLAPGHAFAGLSGCDTDPTVFLSDGAVISLSATIQDDISDIQSVNYVLRIPTGTTVTGIVYDQYGSLETVQVVASLGPQSYKTSATVTTGTPQVPVTVNASVGGISCQQHPKSQSGYSGQTLTMAFMNC